MLVHLHVKNLALIDEIEVEFGPGLNILTGETGAGKSILLGAIGLTLGQRADSSAIMDKTKKCIVEIEYNIAGYALMVRRERPRLFRTGYGQEGVDCRRKITLFYQRYPGK